MTARFIATLAFSVAALTARADVKDPHVPAQFVCTIAAAYQLSQSGALTPSSEQSVGGTVTIDTERLAVTGDGIAARLYSWTAVPLIDKRDAAKLVGSSKLGIAEIAVMTSRPIARGAVTWYPFVFFDGGLGSVVSGTCRGAR